MKLASKFILLIFIIQFPINCFCENELTIKYVKVNHLPIEQSPKPQRIQLYSKNNDLQIEFLPINHDSVTYKYQLQNYEMDWITSSYPVARYMALPAGNFTLIFTANQYGKEISRFQMGIDVQKSLTDAWWFYPMLAFYALLLIGGGIYLFFLYNFRQKMKLQKLQNKIASDLHDEIGSTLSSIAISSNFVKNSIIDSPPVIKTMLERMKNDSEETVHAIRDTVWALNPQNDTIQILIEKIHSFAKQLFIGKGINLLFVNNLPLNKNIVLNIESRKNFFLIAKELLNNIAKHAEATEVNLVFELKKESIFMTIEDNGKGFEIETKYEGNGLKNLKRRAEESFMDLKIDSNIGKGTKIKLEVPLI